jgi:arylsulfatase A-like enzyme
VIHFFEDDRWELYDLDADLSETDDLSAREPELTDELRTSLQRWWADTDAFLPTQLNPQYRPGG